MIFEHAYWYVALFLEALAVPNCTPLSELTKTHVTDELRKRRLNALAAALILLGGDDDECLDYLRQPVETHEALLTLEYIESRLVYDALEKYDKQRKAPLFIPLFLETVHRSHGCATTNSLLTRAQVVSDVERCFFGYSDAAVAASAAADAGGIDQSELRAYRNLLHMHPC